MRRNKTYSSAERRADGEARAEAERAPARRMRGAFFIATLALLMAVIGATLDPQHRLNGFLFGGLGGMFVGIALLAFPRDRDYPQDGIDRMLD